MLFHIHKDEPWTFTCQKIKVFRVFFSGECAREKSYESWYEENNNEIRVVCTKPEDKFDFKFIIEQKDTWDASCRGAVGEIEFVISLNVQTSLNALEICLVSTLLILCLLRISHDGRRDLRFHSEVLKEKIKLFCHHLSTLIKFPFRIHSDKENEKWKMG